MSKAAHSGSIHLFRASRFPVARWLMLPCICLAVVLASYALEPREYTIEASSAAQLSPPALLITWPRADFARQYILRRRTDLNEEWGQPLVTLPADATGYTDLNVNPGTAYEYEIQMELNATGYEGTWINSFSYLYSGIDIPVADQLGRALVLVDSSVSSRIAGALDTFKEDLTGAGWTVTTREVSRDASPPEVKSIITAEDQAAAGKLRSVVLVGHVPVPYSGNIAPDFHESHKGAWPADVYYADLTGSWTDTVVQVQSEDSPANDNFPGDGKFDQSEIPGRALLEIGRVDFANLPSFSPSTEFDLLNTYFRKNHEFRHRLFTAPRRALVHDNFGDVEGDAPAVDAWRFFSPFFGRGTIREVGPGSLIPTLNSEAFLWAYGCGGGSFWKADGVGSTTEFAAADPKAVFYILHGSYFGDWNTDDNFLRAAMAVPSMSLASIWSGVPHWYMHHMGLGATLGFSTRISQNNRGTYKSYRNFFPAQVHIALLGDPTLTMFPVIPPHDLSVEVRSGTQMVHLNWAASGDENIVGYHIYHSTTKAGPFQRITQMPIAETRFEHAVSSGTHEYMVRAIKRENTGSGTFFNASQGIFASITTDGGGSPGGDPTNSVVSSIAVEQGGRIHLKFSGPGEHRFQVLVSTNGSEWKTAADGISAANGAAEFSGPLDPTRLKLYRIYWP